MAAVLACRDDALLSHQSAAALWGFRPSVSAHVDVTAPRGRSVSREGIRVHHARQLHPDHRTVRDGIPVTTVACTLLDLAEALSPTQLQRAFEEADRLELIDMRAIDRLTERCHGRHGLKPLAALVATHRGPAPLTHSELERRFLDLCREAGLPPPMVNAQVAGLEVDALWPKHRLVVELDGYAFHHHRASFERDRERDAVLQLAGHRVLRMTHRRLELEPVAVAATVRSMLGDARGGRSHPSNR
jgi:very-short-patch-repair endonuclease